MTPACAGYQPGSPEHRTWEHVNVHEPRRYPGIERDTATERANGRMAALKARMTPQAERSRWVDDICAEVEAATRECGPNRKPPEPAEPVDWAMVARDLTSTLRDALMPLPVFRYGATFDPATGSVYGSLWSWTSPPLVDVDPWRWTQP